MSSKKFNFENFKKILDFLKYVFYINNENYDNMNLLKGSLNVKSKANFS